MPIFASSDTQVLTVGVPVDRCPMFYIDKDSGEIVGIGVDLMKSAAKEAGMKISFEEISEQNLKEALDNTDYDLVMPFGSAIESASGKPSVVSDNLIQTPFTLVNTGKHVVSDISMLKIGMLRSLGAGAETVKELYPNMMIIMYDSMPECVGALRKGEVDALLHNSYVWSYVLQKPSYKDLVVQPSAMFSMDFRAGTIDTPKGRELVERLNKGIALVPDTKRQAIVLDYTTRKLYKYDFSDMLYAYRYSIVIGTLLFAALMTALVLRQKTYFEEQKERMRLMEDIDPLTGVLSHNGFRKKVEELLANNPDTPYTISYSNIKDFKFINDSFGWKAGDELLKFWTERSLEVLTEKEAIGRYDGDHFVVLRCIGGNEQIIQDEKYVLTPVRNYFKDRGKDYLVRLCTGMYVLMPTDYQDINVDKMLDYARIAEKKVRATKRDGFEFYNPKQWDKGKRTSDIISKLPSAIESGEIQVWYQPQVNYKTGKIIGAEALCRWFSQNDGFISPGEFIPVLEEAGLIYDLDCHVWDTVCKDLKRWNEQGRNLCVSVNLSRLDIVKDPNVADHFNTLVEFYDLSPRQLRIEITESAYVENADTIIKTTTKLREAGFEVEMDDFGSGYSSLNMLKEVVLDRIKLDLRFITGSGDQKMGRTILSYMVQMIHAIGTSLIAEGVETLEQADFLGSLGVEEMQGYYFYKPMPVDKFEELGGDTTI
ncbi:MAG: EAL domain-containing protein [Butyrivibrio sp.]|nr:EAL domain-containing protein [Butyrivibrio sp.]